MQSSALLRRAGARAPAPAARAPATPRRAVRTASTAPTAGEDLGFKTMRAGIKVRESRGRRQGDRVGGRDPGAGGVGRRAEGAFGAENLGASFFVRSPRPSRACAGRGNPRALPAAPGCRAPGGGGA